jgi:hypothetical protein
MTDNKPSVHHAGELATYDCFGGLISCKVLDLFTHHWTGVQYANILITATDNKMYRRGEVITANTRLVYPRNGWKRSRRGPSYVIVQPYIWE